MPRKEKILTLDDGGRELKVKVKQMSARALARWVGRTFFLVAGAGIEVPVGVGVAEAGEFLLRNGLAIMKQLSFDSAEPLANELLKCCSVQIGKMERVLDEQAIDDHVEDWKTIYKLQYASLEINFGFSNPEADAAYGFRWSDAIAAPGRAA